MEVLISLHSPWLWGPSAEHSHPGCLRKLVVTFQPSL